MNHLKPTFSIAAKNKNQKLTYKIKVNTYPSKIKSNEYSTKIKSNIKPSKNSPKYLHN